MKTTPESFEYRFYNNQDIWAYGFKLSHDYNKCILKLPPTFGRIENSKFIPAKNQKKIRHAFDLHFAKTYQEALKDYNELIANYSEELVIKAQDIAQTYSLERTNPLADYNIRLKLTERFTLDSCNTEEPNSNNYGFTINLNDITVPGISADLVRTMYNPDTHELTIETWPNNPESDKHHIINIIIPKN